MITPARKARRDGTSGVLAVFHAAQLHLCPMRNSLLFLFSFTILVAVSCNNQRKTVSAEPLKETDPRWVQVDSLSNIGQYADALSLTDTIVAEARASGDYQLEFRALMSGAFPANDRRRGCGHDR